MIPLFRTLVLSLLLIAAAFAADKPFTQAEFDRLQQEGDPVLIWIHADWCPTCRAQEPVLNKLLARDEFKPLHALRVDFDQQKDVVQAFKAIRQSTLIVFKGGKEVGRSLGVTDEGKIKALLSQAL